MSGKKILLKYKEYVEKDRYMNSYVQAINQQSTNNDPFWWDFIRQ